ncbi:MAG: TonB-dependent receptor [Niastella sp.]|nr:TonB-dependent receptor [Niastella sp.]
MRKRLIFIVLFSGLIQTAFSQYTLSGKVLGGRKQTPVSFAIVSIPALDLWATANAKGEFSIKEVPAGNVSLTIEYLGYEKKTYEFILRRDTTDLIFILNEFNLQLDEVLVTARKKAASLTTSYVIDRTALDHMQMLNVRDATSLLPGGKTNQTNHLATSSAQPIAVNGTSGEMGNALFGVAVEVDGVRLSNNAIPGKTGSDTRNIASSNVESIEIITGLPSVEHGDMTNGMVRITTRRGKSPLTIEMMTKPNTKQVAAGKGFGVGHGRGVLNMNLEHTRSIASLTSPYTTYVRNNLTLQYSNTLQDKQRQPIFIDFGVTGNLGGYNSKSDPDLFVNTYSKQQDQVLRGNASFKWLLNKRWITNIEFTGTVNYNNQLSEVSRNRSAASSVAAIHARREGYNVGQLHDENPAADLILIEPGYWYERSYDDSKVLNTSARFKANWSRKWGAVNNNVLAGGEYAGSGNKGAGQYYADMRYAPTWREYRYDQISSINNYAWYVEDKVQWQSGRSLLRVAAGVRGDLVSVSGSEYGGVNSLSPRITGEWVFWEKARQKVRDLSVRAGWGKTVKLPSFSVLYPEIGYRDFLTFAPGTTSDGKTFYAYYTMPSTRLFNPDLRWQQNIHQEVAVNANVNGTKITLTAEQDKTRDAYTSTGIYSPFTYKFTGQSSLEQSHIPIGNRTYTVDQQTGVVTVTDKTGAQPTETLSYREITRFISNRKQVNGSPVLRRRLSWIVDFRQIAALKTSIRVDGNYYYYKGIEETVTTYMPNDNATMADGNPYKFVGFFTGGAVSANGSVSKSVNVNFTTITHIPAIRLIVSARIECSLYDYSQNLSEIQGQQRGFVLDNRNANDPSVSKSNIYAGDQFAGVYPDYYVSLDDMNTPIPFAEKFSWAKTNDQFLYNELAKMVVKSNTNYYFNPNRVSFYYSANIGITKEIGRFASLSFNATNFINNLSRVRSSWNNAAVSLFGGSNIPAFYYGLSLRIKV